MKWVLKILKGANAGAEIELADGAVLFGSADSCDIVLADAAVPPEAFVLETSDAGVACKVLPDGEARQVELYTLQNVAGISFAIGEIGAPWPEIKEPAPPAEEKPAEEKPAEEKPAGEAEPERSAPSPAESAKPAEAPQPKRGKLGGCLLMLLCFVFGFVLALVLYAMFGTETLASQNGWRSAWERLCKKCGKDTDKTAKEAQKQPTITLEGWAKKHNLTIEENDGVKKISGNFEKRSEKLDAVAMAYRLAPQAVVDISDDETLRSGVEAVLFTVTENRIELREASNRKVVLDGKAKSKDELLNTVAAICTDVNHVRVVDDTSVECEDGARTEIPTVFLPVAEDKKKDPEFPVTGIITTPYPCLLLKDGSRASIGAMIGTFRVEKIEPDQVILSQGEEEIIWKP
ncbi:MAG: hypothetical protein IJJ26_12205 [Victivallales bacterium]|nr:hypothetical protein [Victivallales bacterium]